MSLELQILLTPPLNLSHNVKEIYNQQIKILKFLAYIPLIIILKFDVIESYYMHAYVVLIVT